MNPTTEEQLDDSDQEKGEDQLRESVAFFIWVPGGLGIWMIVLAPILCGFGII